MSEHKWRELFIMLHDPSSTEPEQCLAYKEKPVEPLASLAIHVIEYDAYEIEKETSDRYLLEIASTLAETVKLKDAVREARGLFTIARVMIHCVKDPQLMISMTDWLSRWSEATK